MEDKNKSDSIRHSCAHLLAAAVKELWPGTHNAIGPAIENGFYQDFDFGKVKIFEDDLPKIEEKMREMLKSWGPFEEKEVSVKQALEDFAENPYKLELIKEFAKEGKKITENNPGGFLDLCKGGHSKDPQRELKHFKLLSIAGAYWRGDEKNKMLTRIYGTVFPTKDELDKYLWQIEESKKRDHRKIGQELKLFTISEKVGQGLILWLPKGNIIKEQLEDWAKATEKKWGYQRVTTPHITRSELFYVSGHLPYYKADMYPPMKIDDKEEYFLKPMNCPHHHMIFQSDPKSYKELPLRLAEYGGVYRYEASGQLFGLMRVRGMTQNDAHIYCTLDQAVDEFVEVMRLHEYYYKTLGITEYYLELALRDPENKTKYHGDEKMWQLAEELMRKAVAKTEIKMIEQKGSAAFYGPKIDFIVKSSIGREFAVSTNQIDLYMGRRFNLEYVDEHGKPQTPVIIHRAPLGSHERFIGFLIEHYAGALPLWLSPIQVSILPISERHLSFAQKIKNLLDKENIRAGIDADNKTVGNKIRSSTLQKIPYMVIIGDKELQDESLKVAVRTREGKDLGSIQISKFIENLKEQIGKFL